MKNIPLIIIIALILQGCVSTKINSMQFEKIIYHSSMCFGSCPMLDIEINKNKEVKLKRQLFKIKAEVDSLNSGNFKGKLSNKQMNKMLQVLEASNYENLKFPNVDCCDGVVTTFIIYANGKKTFLKSMMPPIEAEQFINYFKNLALEIQLPKTNEEFEIE